VVKQGIAFKKKLLEIVNAYVSGRSLREEAYDAIRDLVFKLSGDGTLRTRENDKLKKLVDFLVEHNVETHLGVDGAFLVCLTASNASFFLSLFEFEKSSYAGVTSWSGYTFKVDLKPYIENELGVEIGDFYEAFINPNEY